MVRDELYNSTGSYPQSGVTNIFTANPNPRWIYSESPGRDAIRLPTEVVGTCIDDRSGGGAIAAPYRPLRLAEGANWD